jgi:hypothetical protein
MTASAAIPAVRTTPGITPGPEKMPGSVTSLAGGAEDLYIIDKGVFRHIFLISKIIQANKKLANW